MAVVIGVRRQWEYTGNDISGSPCIFPRDVRNQVFVDASGFRRKTVAKDSERYMAFPFMITINGYLLMLYSNSDSHASGTQQWASVSTDNGANWTSEMFTDGVTTNTALISSVMNNGDVVILKAWTFKKVAGVVQVFTNTHGLGPGGENYALWSRAKLISGTYYRTGYFGGKSALFKSTDQGETWQFVSVMFEGVGLQYNESDFIVKTNGDWFAVCREDIGTGNAVYQSTSTDAGATWSVPTLLNANGIAGRQPCLEKLADGSVILALGDRTGTAGYDSSGISEFGFNATGIKVWRSTNDGSTWSFSLRIEGMYSTDGGQPMVAPLPSSRIGVAYYTRRNIDVGPVVAFASFAPEVL